MFDLKTRILIAEDVLPMRLMIVQTCKSIGFRNLSEATNGKEAWDMLSLNAPPIGLVISDWNMPEISGLEFLKMAREDPRFKKLPFVMVTVEDDEDRVVECIKARVSGYIIKPFTLAQFKKKLEEVHQRSIAPPQQN